MVAIVAWLEAALERAHAVMVRHFVRVTDDPATGMRECAEVIRAAAEISAFNKAKVCAERQGEPAMVGLATEQVIALAATPMRSPSVTEDAFERFYLTAWATILHAARTQEPGPAAREPAP